MAQLAGRLTADQLKSLTREEQEVLFRALTAEEEHARLFPLAAFKPHDKQAPFHLSTRRIRIYLGANQSGKTTSGVAEALAHALGYRPWRVPDFFDRLHRDCLPARNEVPREAWVLRADGIPIAVPNRGIIVSGQGIQRGTGTTIWPMIQELWGAHYPLQSWHGPLGTPLKIQLSNGSELFLASAGQERLTFEGTRFDWGCADEPVAAYVFNGLWRGLIAAFGSFWFTQTPLGAESRWLYTSLVAKPPDNVEVFTVGIRDNPHLTEDAVREFEETTTWTDQERSARLFGRFEFLSDVIWDGFRESHHVIPTETLPSNWMRGLTVDPHTRKPWLMGWWALDPTGRIFFYREHPTGDYARMRSGALAPAQMVTLIRTQEGKERMAFRFMDPNAGKSPSATREGMKTLQQEMAEYGLEFACKISDDVLHGVGAVADVLRCDLTKPISVDNRPRLVFMDCCRNLVAAMTNFAYLPIRTETRQHEIVSEEYKDGADVVRYTVVAPKNAPLTVTEYVTEKQLRAWEEE